MVAGMAVLDPVSMPHPPHQHPEEEFMIVASGTGEIECAGEDHEGGTRRDDVLRGQRHPWDHSTPARCR